MLKLKPCLTLRSWFSFTDTFMDEETAEFEIGKRHLATIMGADPDLFTQEDIDVWSHTVSIHGNSLILIVNWKISHKFFNFHKW